MTIGRMEPVSHSLSFHVNYKLPSVVIQYLIKKCWRILPLTQKFRRYIGGKHCVVLTDKPPKGKWFCPTCRESRRTKTVKFNCQFDTPFQNGGPLWRTGCQKNYRWFVVFVLKDVFVTSVSALTHNFL